MIGILPYPGFVHSKRRTIRCVLRTVEYDAPVAAIAIWCPPSPRRAASRERRHLARIPARSQPSLRQNDYGLGVLIPTGVVLCHIEQNGVERRSLHATWVLRSIVQDGSIVHPTHRSITTLPVTDGIPLPPESVAVDAYRQAGQPSPRSGHRVGQAVAV